MRRDIEKWSKEEAVYNQDIVEMILKSTGRLTPEYEGIIGEAEKKRTSVIPDEFCNVSEMLQ